MAECRQQCSRGGFSCMAQPSVLLTSFVCTLTIGSLPVEASITPCWQTAAAASGVPHPAGTGMKQRHQPQRLQQRLKSLWLLH